MWNTPVALSIVARAPSLRAYGYWPMALSIVEAETGRSQPMMDSLKETLDTG